MKPPDKPPPDPNRLKRVFDKPELARLVERLKTRFERGISGKHLTLAHSELAERKAIATLLGRPVGQSRSLRIDISKLEKVIQRAELAPDLRTAIEWLCGPLRNLAEEKAAEQAAWQRVFQSIETEVVQLDIKTGFEKIRKDGLLKLLSKGDVKRAATLLHQTMEVIRQLPGQGQTLSTLAAKTLGDAHALDTGRPVATLVKRAIRPSEPDAAHRTSDEGKTSDKSEEADESERELWAAAGILVGGAITSTVLVLNLPVAGKSVTANIIHQAGQQGQPLWLTLRQLVRDPPRWQLIARTVYICENPAVVAEAADRFGTRCAPLVCTYGQPRAAVNHLLGQLQNAGAELAYHGDFDWPGITIANGIMRRFGAKPWHFNEKSYRQAAEKGKMVLKGRPVIAEWDPGLSHAMAEIKISIPEESVLELLWDALQVD